MSDVLYLWVKSGHIIAVIAWMAAMLYLPRLFVYHSALPAGSDLQSATFKVMERRLLKAIMTPAMIGTWLFGLTLTYQSGFYAASWLHWKFALVLVMSACHGWFAVLVKDFQHDRNRHDQRFYRILNELPTVLMIAIVLLVVLKPGS